MIRNHTSLPTIPQQHHRLAGPDKGSVMGGRSLMLGRQYLKALWDRKALRVVCHQSSMLPLRTHILSPLVRDK